MNRKTVQFPTGSRYHGGYNDATNTMEGFGIYTYPDGTEYRGFFMNGRYHGFGCLKLPTGFTYKGYFEKGKFVETEEMRFGDGLEFVGELDEDFKLNTDKWKYLKGNDRRFKSEIETTLPGVVPETEKTREKTSLDNVDSSQNVRKFKFDAQLTHKILDSNIRDKKNEFYADEEMESQENNDKAAKSADDEDLSILPGSMSSLSLDTFDTSSMEENKEKIIEMQNAKTLSEIILPPFSRRLDEGGFLTERGNTPKTI